MYMNLPAGLQYEAVAHGRVTPQHRDTWPMPAVGRGWRWVRARGAQPQGLEVLMLLISIDFSWLICISMAPLGRPEGQLNAAGAAGKMLGQQVLLCLLPPPTAWLSARDEAERKTQAPQRPPQSCHGRGGREGQPQDGCPPPWCQDWDLGRSWRAKGRSRWV